VTKIDLFSGLPQDILQKRKKSPEPSFIEPMLATLTTDYFSSKDWIYEHKFDGERCLAFKKNGNVILKSRANKEMNNEYPELVKALAEQPANNFVIDGEIVALNQNGLSDFQLLQGRINLRKSTEVAQKEKAVPIYYQIFDAMYVGGYDIRDLPLLARKTILKKLLEYAGPLVYSTHRSTNGLEFFKEACKLHWEGLIAKRAQSPYVGVRSRDWLKFKCIMEQELVIIGYTDPQGSRTDFGALLVGYYDGDKLVYAGKVGTGYTRATLKMLGTQLHKLQISQSPVVNYTESTRGVHWVKPQLVAEIRFAEWTKADRLRVPRYKGLRDDKAAKDVVKEIPSTK
jgi:bifunctional non-homologous end joining protein LigD